MNNPLKKSELELLLAALRSPNMGEITEVLMMDHNLARQIPGPMGEPSRRDVENYLCARLESMIAEMNTDEAFEE